MTDRQRYAAVVVVALMVGWWAGAAGSRDPKPLEDRPVLRWIARTAKSLLWVAVFVEEDFYAEKLDVFEANTENRCQTAARLIHHSPVSQTTGSNRSRFWTLPA